MRYSQFSQSLGISNGLVAAGLMKSRAGAGAGKITGREYYLADKGWNLKPFEMALTQWG